MKKHLELKNIIIKSTIKEINDILIDINTENIDEKFIFTDLTQMLNRKGHVKFH